MSGGGSIDPALRALGGRSRYQVLQVLAINLGVWGAAFQLLDNVFIGPKVSWHHCAPPTLYSIKAAASLQDPVISWNSSLVTYGKCEITVRKDDHQVNTYPCLFGYRYRDARELSFRTEFDLVCDQALWADFLQTLVIVGQGCGAITSSFLSDRYGRKRVLVYSQVGLLVVGLAIGLAPTYAALALLKFLVGCMQQGVITAKATMSIELFPSEFRSMTPLLLGVMWLIGTSGLPVIAYVMQESSWRTLQCTLSAVSLVAVFQMWYVDESLRWLVANGKKESAVHVLERAARVNCINSNAVLKSLYATPSFDSDDIKYPSEEIPLVNQTDSPTNDNTDDTRKRARTPDPEWEWVKEGPSAESREPFQSRNDQYRAGTQAGSERVASKLSLVDLFGHKHLCFNTLVIWITWFTCAFCTFTLILMSTSLRGNPYLNFFLTVMTDLPSGLLFYFLVDRSGRKPAIQLFLLLAGAGLMSCGVFRALEDSWGFERLSVISAMVGMMGSSGMFGAMFFYTPELYPTNIRQQALGIASFAGRCGGMIAPFMVPLSEYIVWLPGALTGSLCFIVIFLFRFLPETQGRELPQTLEDIDAWYSNSDRRQCLSVDMDCTNGRFRKWTRSVKKYLPCNFVLNFSPTKSDKATVL